MHVVAMSKTQHFAKQVLGHTCQQDSEKVLAFPMVGHRMKREKLGEEQMPVPPRLHVVVLHSLVICDDFDRQQGQEIV
jgi:hypothetical protein